MKRSRLKPAPWNKPGTEKPRKPLKRSRMKQVSATERARQRKYADARKQLKQDYPFCMACGSRRQLTVHEIAKGSHRKRAYELPCCQLVACWSCNSGALNDYSVWPLERQLAAQWRYMPEHFDLAEFNRVRGRDERAITIAEVDVWTPTV